ncbi:TetR family transcriptional regulator [Streptomyces sp. NPDC056373]|uniref:TetR family transcriptional regulator n=1 Tax=Streptomyces sp. NPDC056373 TaxID=3345798 RepID=UPI0035D6C6AF
MLRQPVTSRGKETRGKILDAGARLFAERGYLGTDVQDIVKESGVGRGAFYHHFRTGDGASAKERVAHAVVSESFVMDFLPQAVLPRLQAVIDASMLLAVASPRVTVVRAALRIALEQGHPLYGFLWKGYIPVVDGWLTEAGELGELLPGVVPQEVATVWVDGYTGADARCRHDYEQLPGEIAKLNRLMVRAVATPETMMRLDVSVERGLSLFRDSELAGLGELPGP